MGPVGNRSPERENDLAGSEIGFRSQVFCLKVQCSCHFINKEMSRGFELLLYRRIQKVSHTFHLPSL